MSHPSVHSATIAAARALVLSVVSVGVGGGVAGVGGCSHEPDDVSGFRGARLGMSAPDTRQRFHAPAAGGWAASVATTGEEAMTWTATDPASDVTTASFEFHNGMLVAIRAAEKPTAPEAQDLTRRVTSVTVRRVEAPAGAFAASSSPEAHLTILARDCPTHAAEVAAILK